MNKRQWGFEISWSTLVFGTQKEYFDGFPSFFCESFTKCQNPYSKRKKRYRSIGPLVFEEFIDTIYWYNFLELSIMFMKYFSPTLIESKIINFLLLLKNEIIAKCKWWKTISNEFIKILLRSSSNTFRFGLILQKILFLPEMCLLVGGFLFPRLNQ